MSLTAESPCVRENPFIKKLGNVQILESPAKSSGQYCKSEWDLHGTCCNEQDLVKHAKYGTKAIQTHVEQLNRDFAVFKAFYDRLLPILEQVAAL